jgi:hypothetical protein
MEEFEVEEDGEGLLQEAINVANARTNGTNFFFMILLSKGSCPEPFIINSFQQKEKRQS